MPVAHDGRIIGLLEVDSATARPWSRRETALAQLFAAQLGALATTSALRPSVPAPA